MATNNLILDSLTAINDAYNAGLRASEPASCSECSRLRRENATLKDHVKHLEDSLAVALGEKMGLDPETEQRERESEQAQVMADHRREVSEDPPQRVPIIGPVKS